MNKNIVNFIKSNYKPLEVNCDQLSDVRKIHRMTFPDGNSYSYYEWNHAHEAQRNLLQDYEYYVERASWGKYCLKDAVAIDIGAHTGDTSIIMANLVGNNGLVLAFEPNPRVFPILNLNIKNNPTLNILPFQLAIAKEHNKEIEYIDHGNLLCNGGLTTDQWGASESLEAKIMKNENAEMIKVKGINLVDFLNEIKLQTLGLNVAFIKIDCEGYDKEIIRESASFIKEIKPIIFCEWFAWFTEKETNDLFDVIENIIDYVPVNPITLEVQSATEYIPDLLLVPKGQYTSKGINQKTLVENITLSIAMMGYNSHNLIKDKLATLLNACDEFIYLDQGSDDGTKELIESSFRKQDILVEIPKFVLPNEGFSYIRNIMKNTSRSDWVLFLDTDEYIDPENLEKLKKYLISTEQDIIGLKRYNLNANFEDYIFSNQDSISWLQDNYDKYKSNPSEIQIRVCRNLPNIQWAGMIHEHLLKDGEAKFTIFEHSEILHLHGLPSPQAVAQKNTLYAYLIYKSLATYNLEGTNPYWYREYFMSNITRITALALAYENEHFDLSNKIILELKDIKSIAEIHKLGRFSHDWFSANVSSLLELINTYLPNYALQPVEMLEIGSYEGLSSCWFLSNILLHERSKLTCIDTFKGSSEQKDLDGLHTVFLSNVLNTGSIEKVDIEVGYSHDILPKLIVERKLFDLIYVDGSHSAFDVLTDAVMSFYLLKSGGIMIFDDYLWPGSVDISYVPKAGIDAFINIFHSKIDILPNTRNYQIQIRKK